jgi:hypothetical protein
MRPLFITPDDTYHKELKGYDFELIPVTTEEYMNNANYMDFLKQPKQIQAKVRKFVASKIKTVNGEPFDRTKIEQMTPTIFFAVMKQIVDEMEDLNQEESSFHSGDDES